MISWLFQNVAKPAQLALRERVSRRIDRQLNVETTDEVVAAALGIDIAVFRNTQRALGWSGASLVLRRLQLQPSDVFLDIGCGVGRILCAAARTDVARVIGLDIDPRMAQIASQNTQRLRGRRAQVDVVTGDATQFEVPDEVTVVFLYNPFGGDVLTAALRQVIASADRRPRPIRLVYAHPFEHEHVMALGRFAATERISLGWRPGKKWAIKLAVQFYELTKKR
jgi:SAM-dependent methyltransferase